MTEEMNLTDIPDLSSLTSNSDSGNSWSDGWYEASILESRSFTDRNGNDRVFESSDAVSQKGDSRNIRLQVEVRRADGAKLYVGALTNYRPEDLQADTVQSVIADNAKDRADQDPSLTRARLTLARLSTFQKIGGVRNFARTGEGGLDLSSLWGKTCWVKLGPDDRNAAFKAITQFRHDKPTKARVL